MSDSLENGKVSRGRLAIVDDDEAMLFSLKRILSFYGFETVGFAFAADALSAVEANPLSFDAVLTDLNMPGMDGIELMNAIKALDKDAVVIVLTGFPSADNAISALRGGAFDFLEKPYSNEVLALTLDKGVELRRLRKSMAEQRTTMAAALDSRSEELRNALSLLSSSYMKTMEIIVSILELKEHGAIQHCIRVGRRCVFLASLLGVPKGKDLEEIGHGTILHDIGKVGIPDAILDRRASLTRDEDEILRRHPKIGYDIINTIPDTAIASEIVLSHHERFDGSGYPRGLSGEKICLGARIFSVIGYYDKLRFVNGLSQEDALREIVNGAGSSFDPVIVEAFKSKIDAFESIGF